MHTKISGGNKDEQKYLISDLIRIYRNFKHLIEHVEFFRMDFIIEKVIVGKLRLTL